MTSSFKWIDTHGAGGGVLAASNVLLALLVDKVLDGDANEDGDWESLVQAKHCDSWGSLLWRSSLEHWSNRPRPSAPEPAPIRLERVPPSMPELTSVVSPA